MTPLERRLSIALAVSVALNLFIAGFFVARGVSGRGMHGGRHHHGPFLGPRALLEAGGPEAEPLVEGLMKRHGPELRKERGALRSARRGVHDALSREPFDAAALERALAELRARTGSSQAQMHEALVELARQLPAEQRKRLAKRAHVLGVDAPHPH